jgi:hypothetical protein
MLKPIFLVGIPFEYGVERITEFQKYLDLKLEQYYPLVYSTNGSEIEFKCFFEKDMSEVKYEELKKIITDSLNQ